MVSYIEIWNKRNYKATTEYKLIPFGSSGLSLFDFFYFLFFTCKTSKVPPQRNVMIF